ncbi:MAG TPA: translation initiation factor IF-3, partial [Nocardioides sp.]|nr:translation initiation factor IF-3 [Nocardioides sp.]
NQVNTVIKEIKLRPKIDPHDYGTKKGHVERFLKGGDKVKVTIMFRGREQSRPELGFRLLQRLAEDVLELGTVESAPKQDGRNMVMVIAPTKKKAQAMAEQRRKRDGSAAGSHAERDTVDLGTEFDAVADLEAEGYAPETPKVDVVEADVVEAVEVEAPVVEAPVVETPVVEAPVVETPVVEVAEVEAPVVAAPVVEAPRAPAAKAPAPKAPAPKAPAPKAPAAAKKAPAPPKKAPATPKPPA